jgi:GTP cyclohydrolase II
MHESGENGSTSERVDSINPGDRAADNAGLDTLLKKIAGHQPRLHRPFVTLSYAQSLDGCIAGRRGEPLVLSCHQALILTHQLRAAHDAILVGIGTVLADNPQLTVRLVEGEMPQPVILDSRLRLPLNINLLRLHPLRPLVVAGEQADAARRKILEDAGARVLRLPSDSRGRICLPAMLERLRELGIKSLMVEGGARVITSFLSEQLVDHLILTVAPVFIGGVRGVRRLRQPDEAFYPYLSNLRHQPVGTDMVFWGDPVWENR